MGHLCAAVSIFCVFRPSPLLFYSISLVAFLWASKGCAGNLHPLLMQPAIMCVLAQRKVGDPDRR